MDEEKIKKEENNKVEASNTVEIETIKDDERVETKKEEKVRSAQKEEAKPKAKKKKKINKQLLGLIIIIISCIVITICLIVLKIRQINKMYEPEEENNVFNTESKVQDDELKYVVTDNDTLDYNNIEYTNAYIIDGVETTDREEFTRRYPTLEKKIMFLKISGLKDKNVENKINEAIKNKALELSEEYQSISVRVMGNFNGIFSIGVYSTDENRRNTSSLNFDLNTGEEFELEDVFIKSAPIVNILYNGLLESLAWDINIDYDSMSEEEYFALRKKLSDMNNRDTSEFEEELFELSKWYKENKGNIDFMVTPTRLYVENVKLDSKDKSYNLGIPLYNYKDCVAIYKRFLNNDIFEISKYNAGYIPFSMPLVHYSGGLKDNQVDYGKKSENFFVDVTFPHYSFIEDGEVKEKIKESAKIFANNMISDTSKKASENKQNGYILQSTITIYDSTSDANNSHYNSQIQGYVIPHYEVTMRKDEVELSAKEFKKLDYYLAQAALTPTSGADPLTVKYCLALKNGNFKEYFDNDCRYFFDVNGNYLGDDISVIKDTSKPSYNPS